MIRVVVYWSDSYFNLNSELIEGDDAIGKALTKMNNLRNMGARFVCYASENTDMVGSFGVDSIKDGKLPDGNDYEWKKRRKQ